MPGPAVPGLAGAGRSRPRVSGPLAPGAAVHFAQPRHAPSLPARPRDSRRGLAAEGRLARRPAPGARRVSSQRRHTHRVGLPSPTWGHPPLHPCASKSCEARCSSIAPQPYQGTPVPRPNRPLNFPSPGPRPRLRARPVSPVLDPGPSAISAHPSTRSRPRRKAPRTLTPDPGPTPLPWARVPFPPAGPRLRGRQPGSGKAPPPGDANAARCDLPGPTVGVPGRRRPLELQRSSPSAQAGLVRGRSARRWCWTKY